MHEQKDLMDYNVRRIKLGNTRSRDAFRQIACEQKYLMDFYAEYLQTSVKVCNFSSLNSKRLKCYCLEISETKTMEFKKNVSNQEN